MMSAPPPTATRTGLKLSRRLGAALLALGLGATACIAPDDDVANPPTTDLSSDDIVLTAALETVDNCDALLERIITEASERVGPYGFGNGFYGPIALERAAFGDEEAMEDSDAASTTAGQLTSAAAPEAASDTAGGRSGDFSGTNNQEQGVDEADLVKTDGKRLVTITGNQLRIIDVDRSVPELAKTVKLPEEFWGGELFLNGDTALLMTSGWTSTPFLSDRSIPTDWYPGSPTGRIMEIDLNAGSIVRTMEFEGSYLSAREVDGSIRIVMSAAENRFNFVFPSNPGAEESAEKANRDLVESSTIDMWIPTYRVTEGNETVTEGPIVDCDRVHLPTEFAGFGSLVVMTANIDDGLRVDDALSVFTDGQTVYASPTRLAVAAARWPEFNEQGEPVDIDGYRTAIHSFDISDARTTEYAASGSVRGFLLNRFSMSEYEGYLRVATTDGNQWWGNSQGSESYVTVLEEAGGALAEVGQVGELGPGEQIFAVRFLGDKGYVVTFEQVDPLYTIDLSDPANPAVTGELKITGVSDYLHPVGNDLVIGVGRTGDEEGLTGQVAVSVFDVSDPANPTKIDGVSLGVKRPEGNGENGWAESYSPVSNDPRAFTMWENTMVVPYGWWRSFQEANGVYQEDNGNAAALIDLDQDSGTLTTVGEVSHPKVRQCEGPDGFRIEEIEAEPTGLDPAAATSSSESGSSEDAEASFAAPEDEPIVADESEPYNPEEEYCWTYQPDIRRSVIIGDDLYTVSEAGVAVNRFDGLDPVTWIPFDR